MASQSAPLPRDEEARLRALARLAILDTLPEAMFDDLALLASQVCGVPISLISLIDEGRQWFKAKVGLEASQTPRDDAFCAHAILNPSELMEVPDARFDSRFAGNPLVVGDPMIRFYAGAPILAPDGHPLGTLCVIDTKPRALDEGQRKALMALSRQATALLVLRELSHASDAQVAAVRRQIAELLVDGAPANAGVRRDRRVASVGQLTSGIAHDFNNLLQTINGSFQLIARKIDSPEHIRRWVDGGMATVARGARLTAQLLSFSRDQISTGSPLPVAKAIGDMREMLSRAIGPEVKLHFDLAGADAAVLGDLAQLEAAVLNMVINARDAMAGAGSIAISTREQDVAGDPDLADGEYLTLRVADDGPGMPEEIAGRAFEAFFTTKGEGRGTGLGLAQVQGFAIRAGGVARIESSPGGGTVVALWLRRVPAEAEVAAVSQRAVHSIARGAVRVLLVDDDPALLETMAELLDEAGYQVNRASSGSAALQAIEGAPPDVALVDCAMPDMNGAALAERLRRVRAGLPVLFLTGQLDVGALRPNLGPDAIVLRKPVSLEEVDAAIGSTLSQAGAQRAPLH